MHIENFIYTKENALPDDVCDSLMNESQRLCEISERVDEKIRFGDEQFPNGKLGRNDFQVFMPQESSVMYAEIQECIHHGINEYKHVISSAKTLDLIAPSVKLQYTPIGGGFHEWHCEQGGGQSAARSLVWMIYLNDVTDGGDTEFLYQHLKVQPKKGTLVIWPAGVTHPHRGNPPYSNDKYVVTGWFEVPSNDIYDQAVRYFKHTKMGQE